MSTLVTHTASHNRHVVLLQKDFVSICKSVCVTKLTSTPAPVLKQTRQTLTKYLRQHHKASCTIAACVHIACTVPLKKLCVSNEQYFVHGHGTHCTSTMTLFQLRAAYPVPELPATCISERSSGSNLRQRGKCIPFGQCGSKHLCKVQFCGFRCQSVSSVSRVEHTLAKCYMHALPDSRMFEVPFGV